MLDEPNPVYVAELNITPVQFTDTQQIMLTYKRKGEFLYLYVINTLKNGRNFEIKP